CKIRLAAANLGHLLDEVHQAVIAGQHKGIDQDALLLAAVHLFERFADDQRIKPESIFIHAAVFERKAAWLAVGDHHDLPHVLALLVQQALRKDQAVARVRVVRTHLDAGKLAQRQFFCGIVEEDAPQAVTRILRADQVRERESHFLRRREAILAIQDHAVAAVQHKDRRAGTLVFALMDIKIRIVQIDWYLRALTPDGGKKRLADIQIQRIAELVLPGGTGSLDPGGKVARIVAAEARFAERAQQIFQSFKAQKIERFIGYFELNLSLGRVADSGSRLGLLARLIERNVAIFHQLTNQVVEQLLHLLSRERGQPLHHLLQVLVVKKLPLLQSPLDSVLEIFQRMLVHLAELHVLRGETTLEKEVGKRLQEVFGPDTEIFTGEARIFNLHKSPG